MSNFDKLFGRTYSTVGNSDSDFIIKTRGQVKVQWGKKFIDIIKDGKLNVNVDFMKSVATADDIGISNGIYYVTEDGSIYIVINGSKINILGDINGTYVSFTAKQSTTPEQRLQASRNIGLRFLNTDEAIAYGIEDGIVFIEESNRWYTVKDGVFTLYPSELESPYKKQLILSKDDNNEGALVINGEGSNNSILLGSGMDKVLLYKELGEFYIDCSGNNTVIQIDGNPILSIATDVTTINNNLACDYIASKNADNTSGYKLYYLNGESVLEIDRVIARKASNVTDITYSELVTLAEAGELSTATDYRITDFQNEWELTTEDDVIVEDVQAENEEGNPLWQDEDETIPVIETYKNVHPLIVTASNSTTIAKAAKLEDNKEWDVEYDFNYADLITTAETEEGIVELTARGRITKLTDEKGNSCNYDFKHLRFKVAEDGEEKWVYTFRDRENDLSLSDTCVGNVLTINNYEIKSETVTVRNGNVVTLSGNLANNNFGTINSNMTINGTFNKFTVDGVLENVTFKDLSSFSKVSTLSLTNVVFNGDVSNTTFHSDISDVDFDETTYALLYDATKVKDVYFNNDVVSVICIPDIPTSSSALSKGMIMMFDGNSDIPTGWAVCDGTEGTPNLTGNFIKASETAGETGEFIPASSGSSTETPITYYSLVFIMKLA